jgi:hypothetical protein
MSIMYLIKSIMSVIYIGAGVFLLASRNIFNLTDFQKFGLSSILIIYGFYRVYLSISEYKKEKVNNEK